VLRFLEVLLAAHENRAKQATCFVASAISPPHFCLVQGQPHTCSRSSTTFPGSGRGQVTGWTLFLTYSPSYGQTNRVISISFLGCSSEEQRKHETTDHTPITQTTTTQCCTLSFTSGKLNPNQKPQLYITFKASEHQSGHFHTL